MAHPKRRQSKTRTAKRRTHDNTVCGACGYYRGKLAIEKEAAV